MGNFTDNPQWTPAELRSLCDLIERNRGELDEEQLRVWVATLCTVGWLTGLHPQWTNAMAPIVGGLALSTTRDAPGGLGSILARYNSIMNELERRPPRA